MQEMALGSTMASREAVHVLASPSDTSRHGLPLLEVAGKSVSGTSLRDVSMPE